MCTQNTLQFSRKMEGSWTLRRCGNFNTGRAEIVLDLPNIVVGRNVEKKYRVDSVNISRQHACFNLNDAGTWVVQDLRSRNGVYVNGTKIHPCTSVRLSENDTIGFGRPSPCGDDIFVYRLCRNPPVRLKQEVDLVVGGDCPRTTVETTVRQPVIVELSDDDDEPVITEVVPPRKKQRTMQKEGQNSLLQVASTPLSTQSTIKKEPSLEVTSIKPEPIADCFASGSSASMCNGVVKTEWDGPDTGKPLSSRMNTTEQCAAPAVSVKKEVMEGLSQVGAVKEEPKEVDGACLPGGGLPLGQDGDFTQLPLKHKNVLGSISSEDAFIVDTLSVQKKIYKESSVCPSDAVHSVGNLATKESNNVPAPDTSTPDTCRPEDTSVCVQNKQGHSLKECVVVLHRLEKMLTVESLGMNVVIPDSVKHKRSEVAEQGAVSHAVTAEAEALDSALVVCDLTPAKSEEQSVPILSECISHIKPAIGDARQSLSDKGSDSEVALKAETTAITSHSGEPTTEDQSMLRIKEERTYDCEIPQFSQEDVIVILSDDEDDTSGPSITVKQEPEDFDDHICHQEEDEDDDGLWITHESLVKVKSEPEDMTATLPSDETLLNRLVWDDQDPVEENSGETDQELPKDVTEEESENKDSKQDDDNSFFPVLSQGFYSEDNSEKTNDKEKLSASILRRTVLVPPQPVSKAPLKKSSLKERVMKSMKHRVPMPGGGSDVKAKEMPLERRPPSCSGEVPQSSRRFYQVSRFKSRAIHLLDVGESIAVADNCKNRPLSRGVKPAHGVFNKAVERRVDQLSGARAATSSDEAPKGASRLQLAIAEAQRATQSSLPKVVSEELRKTKRLPQVTTNEHRRDMPYGSGQLPTLTESCPQKRPRFEAPFPVKNWSLEMAEKSQPSEERPRVRFTAEALTEQRTEQERAEFADRVRSSLRQRRLVKKSPKVSITTFIGFILSWKVQWLKEQLYCAKTPPLLDMTRLHAKRAMYSSFEEYVYLHYNFLCLETWDQVFHNWKEYFSQTSKMTYSIVVAEQVVKHRAERASDSIMELSCSLVVKPESLKKGAYPLEGHLVRLDLRLREKDNAVLPVFGFIVQSRLAKNKHPTKGSLPLLLQKEHVEGCVVEQIGVQVKTRDLALNFDRAVRLVVVSKISPIMRQVEAILDLDKSPFLQSIVRPNPHHFWNRRISSLHLQLPKTYNEEQVEVICSAVSAVRASGKEQRIVLLHGPPGTGKTHTLVGIVLELIRNCENQKLLVVAPSNTAVDEIGRRLLTARTKQARDGVHVDSLLRVVRIGQEHMIHQDVRGIWLEELVQKNIQKEMREKTQDFDQEISAKQAHVKHCMEKLEAIPLSTYPDRKLQRRLEFEVQHLNTEILRITEKKKAFQEELAKHSRNYYERKVVLLQKAHIILSTINSSRGRLLEEAFGRNSQHSFTCVIVDEATQCTEVELLLSLQYRASRLVLVGDPHQLPATVLSRDAIDLNFQQSLFERFYGYLKEFGSSQPIFLLTRQCRMHTEICSFPSRYFYKGKLRTAQGLDESYASFPLIPYIIFNVANSPEHTEGTTSWLNIGEARFVCLLSKAVLEQTAGRASVGIITPYAAQKNLILSLLGNTGSVEVNTIDGFQGQERDVVILSCVRAYHPRGSIGFVADARRLNVAITRARKSLFICGHLQSLEDSAEWAALIQDGMTRNKVCNVSPTFSVNVVRHIISKRGAVLQDTSYQQ